MNPDHFCLTDRQFARNVLPTDTSGKPRVDDRLYELVHALAPGQALAS